MFNIVLFGAPGAGKGTQAVMIAENFRLIHLSTGDILRKEISTGSELGELARQYTDKGEFVPDKVVIDIIRSQMEQNADAEGFIFDGFPRTIAQAEAFDAMMTNFGQRISAVLALEVETEELVKRLQIRGESSGRADDLSIDVIRNRIKVYNNKTKPLIDYYSIQNKFQHVDGSGDIAEISERLTARIVDLKDQRSES